MCVIILFAYIFKKKTLKNGYLWWKWEMGAEEPVGGSGWKLDFSEYMLNFVFFTSE